MTLTELREACAKVAAEVAGVGWATRMHLEAGRHIADAIRAIPLPVETAPSAASPVDDDARRAAAVIGDDLRRRVASAVAPVDDEFAGHTPGPWRIEKPSSSQSDFRGAWELIAGHRVLASRHPWTYRAAESDANARLIAAAPRLLRELQEAGRRQAEFEQALNDARVEIRTLQSRINEGLEAKFMRERDAALADAAKHRAEATDLKAALAESHRFFQAILTALMVKRETRFMAPEVLREVAFSAAADTAEELAEVRAEADALRLELAEWARLDGNSPGYSAEKARTYGRIAAELKAELAAAREVLARDDVQWGDSEVNCCPVCQAACKPGVHYPGCPIGAELAKRGGK